MCLFSSLFKSRLRKFRLTWVCFIKKWPTLTIRCLFNTFICMCLRWNIDLKSCLLSHAFFKHWWELFLFSNCSCSRAAVVGAWYRNGLLKCYSSLGCMRAKSMDRETGCGERWNSGSPVPVRLGCGIWVDLSALCWVGGCPGVKGFCLGFLGYHKARRRAGNTVAFLLMLYSALLSCVFERGGKRAGWKGEALLVVLAEVANCLGRPCFPIMWLLLSSLLSH